MLPFKSLDAVTATGPGVSRDLETVAKDFTIHVSQTGDPGGGISLEGSLDGSEWITLVTTSLIGTETVSTHYVRFVRASLTSLTGGSSPTVTAWIAAKVDC